MELSILKLTKDEVELEIDEKDPTLVELIAEKINAMEGVERATALWNHPLVGKPSLRVKAKKGKNPVEIVKAAIKELSKEFKALKKKL